jgi:hypothetical protein
MVSGVRVTGLAACREAGRRRAGGGAGAGDAPEKLFMQYYDSEIACVVEMNNLCFGIVRCAAGMLRRGNCRTCCP